MIDRILLALASSAILLIIIDMKLVCDNGADCGWKHDSAIDHFGANAVLIQQRIDWERI
ncbi:MAG: hypothetical protein WBW79_07855 [Desulfocapsaceae bacterium]|jgi:hypothetical protein